MFVNIRAFSSEEEFVNGDVAEAVKWIEGEVEALNKVLADGTSVLLWVHEEQFHCLKRLVTIM
jgi:deoxyribodipyrimidine photolyase